MNKEESWERFKARLLCSNEYLSEEELDEKMIMYYCGWEDYEESINDSGLILCDIKSLKTLSDNSELLYAFKKDVKDKIGTYVLTPTLSRQPLYSLSSEQLEDNLDIHREHLKDINFLLKNVKGEFDE